MQNKLLLDIQSLNHACFISNPLPKTQMISNQVDFFFSKLLRANIKNTNMGLVGRVSRQSMISHSKALDGLSWPIHKTTPIEVFSNSDL